MMDALGLICGLRSQRGRADNTRRGSFWPGLPTSTRDADPALGPRTRGGSEVQREEERERRREREWAEIQSYRATSSLSLAAPAGAAPCLLTPLICRSDQAEQDEEQLNLIPKLKSCYVTATPQREGQREREREREEGEGGSFLCIYFSLIMPVKINI